MIILAIDAFRTLFESMYFGAWYTSLVGFIPISVHDFLVRPENVFVPKFLNVVAAFLIIFIVLRRWIPEEKAKLIKRLQETLSELKTLGGLLPICSSCKKVRDDKGYWNQIESYIRERSDAEFSHGICPECAEELYGEELRALNEKGSSE